MGREDVRLARAWAAFYRARGYNPLPARMDAKRPMIRYASLWDKPLQADVFDRFETVNIQLTCGRYWRLLVIDLDGPAARDHFARLGAVPRTWITHSGGDGYHVWFRLPPDYAAPLPKAVLWRGEGDHSAVERLCDHSLVMAPPSLHPTTGERYRFLDAAHSPKRLGVPADCPGWVLRWRPIVMLGAEVWPTTPRPRSVATASSRRYDRDDVLRAIPDKVGLARSWGVRVAGHPTRKGWVPCHAIDREDSHPSAAIHRDSGHYVDHGSGLRLSLFDLAVAMNVYTDWKEAKDSLAQQFI